MAGIARLIGEPARTAMLDALLTGRALAAGELARVAGVAAATASEHLARMRSAGLVATVAAGRHRYYRLASPEVAQALEALALLAPSRPVTSLRQSRRNAALLTARTCYDHLAGRVGVGIHRWLLASGALTQTAAGLDLTDTGRDRLGELGIDVAAARMRRRVFARSCLDFTERQEHLAGALGAAICARLLSLDWLRHRDPGHRGLRVTDLGRRELAAHFDLDV
ncbi:transcriptional regulator, ArsR family [Stackebrandtia nassauensis DSM 44728]|uniref:Transcriptional regulator, ArsR family n=1 Tax=Stackebrandtia nassauensis (strain DSM 44728 / CIP 108903 / NRRL B-16338 / NBRC 102104 / LLR-40K-21) TaxID=446470 RepID=D3Q3G6_STANL|nr:transcriptional regulator, ArsR family [Stackebrandtia nassauensis DSM 44728]